MDHPRKANSHFIHSSFFMMKYAMFWLFNGSDVLVRERDAGIVLEELRNHKM